MTLKVYISGQITGLSHDEYTNIFTRAVSVLRLIGHEPYSPLDVAACKQQNCHTGARLPNGNYLHSWHCYIKHDLKLLLKCDAIAMLPNWKNSKGAMLEREVAIGAGLDMFFFDHDLVRIF